MKIPPWTLHEVLSQWSKGASLNKGSREGKKAQESLLGFRV